MIYVFLFLIELCIWLPIRKPTRRWEMFIYGQGVYYRQRVVDPEERHWERLREAWKRRDVT